MLRLLLGWQTTRRGEQLRDRIKVNILQMLHCMVPAEAIAAVDLLTTSDEERILCREGCSNDGDICDCYIRAAHSIPERDTAENSVQALLWNELALLFLGGHECLLCQHIVCRGLKQLAEYIEDAPTEWAKEDFLTSSCAVAKAASGKRHRTDPHVKQLVVHDALISGRARSAADLVTTLRLGARKHAIDWSEEILCQLQAASRLSFSEAGIYGFAMDAAQICRPYTDYMLVHQYCADSHLSTVFPPKDREQNPVF